MTLRRNTTADGEGKYSLIEHEKENRIELGLPKTRGEFFVLKLKDVNSRYPLMLYAALACLSGDRGLAKDVFALSKRAGKKSPWCKKPD